jgi:hypothetical protein
MTRDKKVLNELLLKDISSVRICNLNSEPFGLALGQAERVKEIFDYLKEEISMDKIRFALAYVKKEGK